MLFTVHKARKHGGRARFHSKSQIALRCAARPPGTRTEARLFKSAYVSSARAKERPGKTKRSPRTETREIQNFASFLSSNFGWVRFKAGAQRAHKNHRNPTFNLHQARLRAPDQPHRWWSWPSLSTCACRFLNAKAPPLPLPALLHILKAR